MASARSLRTKIAREVGFKPASMLKKNHLNSIYAYKNGDFLIDPDSLHSTTSDEYLDLKKVRVIIAGEFGFDYNPDKYGMEAGPRFNKDQLMAIWHEINKIEDKRKFPKIES